LRGPKINIHFSGSKLMIQNAHGVESISLYDLNGRLLFNKKVNELNCRNIRFEMGLPFLPVGNFICIVTSHGQQKIAKRVQKWE
jgi:hypothetical protein